MATKVEIVDKTKLEFQVPGSSPLFEKTLTASDAAKAGRLVLPKAAAEAYLPRITNSEGQVLIIKDVLDNVWNFHYRFWPNSRMYVLEVAWGSCMQALALQAGDTVVFGHTNPEKELCIGFRKARRDTTTGPNTEEVVENTAANAQARRVTPAEALQHASSSTDHMNGQVADKSEELAVHMLAAMSAAQRGARKTDRVDVLEGEPRCGGADVDTTREEDRRQDQWVQCDDCGTWRRLPAHVIVPEAWTCSENQWDAARASCRVPQELPDEEIEQLQTAPSHRGSPSQEAAGPSAQVQMEPNGRLSRATSRSRTRAGHGDESQGQLRGPIRAEEDIAATGRPAEAAAAGRGFPAKRRKVAAAAEVDSPLSGSLAAAAGLVASSEDEGSGRNTLSMVQLVEAAVAPLDSYLREHGMSSLCAPPGALQGCKPALPRAAFVASEAEGSQGAHSMSDSESDSGTEEEDKKASTSRGARVAHRSLAAGLEDPFGHMSRRARPQKGRRIHGLGRGKQICSHCHAIINTSAKACKECGAQTAFGKRLMVAAAEVAAAWAVKGIAYPSSK